MADKRKYTKLPGSSSEAADYVGGEKKNPSKKPYTKLPGSSSEAADYVGGAKKNPNTSELIKMKKGGASKMWIKDAIKKPGALKKSLGVKKSENIPAKKLAAAAKKPGKMGQRARLAQTLGKMKRG